MNPLSNLLEEAIVSLASWFPEGSFLGFEPNVKGLLAVILVSLICGAVGSLVVGNRMAFFSDALAHCTFAGISLGLLTGVAFGLVDNKAFFDWGIPAIMVVFGILVGLGIAFVRESTTLTSDTVIGVFFAGAIGLGAMLMKRLNRLTYFNPENFLFGSMATVSADNLLLLAGVALVTFTVLGLLYNQLVFTSFNPSLARSRRIPVRLCSYLFIALLALIINLCLSIVGALLINALLLVPVATACNVCRNLRQLFWLTTGLCLVTGVGGMWLSWEFDIADGGGSIVVLGVFLFFLSMLLGPLAARWKPAR
jgi:zinc transport system permease protein